MKNLKWSNSRKVVPSESTRMGVKTSEQIFILFFVDIYACFFPCFEWSCLRINRAVLCSQQR